MTKTININPPVRKFLAADFQLSTWESVKPLFDNLVERSINDVDDLRKFFTDRSELESYLSENFAWRYIKMTCDTGDKEIASWASTSLIRSRIVMASTSPPRLSCQTI